MKTKVVEIQGVEYELRELAHKQAVDIFELTEKEWLPQLASRSVFKDGKPIGKFEDLGLSVTLKLMPVVAQFYGMSEGND